MKLFDVLTIWLLIAAGLQAGLTLARIDLVGQIPMGDMAQKVLAGLMGAAALYQFVQWRAIRRRLKA